jgi:pSer/pThr/pTyr-binding forkhead associated (FHA) protein
MGRFILITNLVNGEIVDRREFQLSSLRPAITIGRLHTCDFTVSQWGEIGQTISRVHCTISLAGEDVFIRDGGDKPSTLGTYWGTRRLDRGEELPLWFDKDETVLAVPPDNPTFKIMARATKVSTLRLDTSEDHAEDTLKVSQDFHQLSCRVAELEQFMEGAIAHLQAQIDELKGGGDRG